ncbi:MAG: dTDP-4-dehydrorhamnose 3,5-epimerase [Verrucomicrobiota bacterium]|jgi:dTDP-4-dehydrorhamnose 3,5-epimerase
MKVTHSDLAGLIMFEPRIFADARGFFFELWNQQRYAENGLAGPFVQDNLSRSQRGTLRGLHFQNPNSQGKLATVLEGEVFDVAVDLRRSSPTFGRWHGVHLTGESKRQFYIPPGFAHGFVVLSESALFHYKCTQLYSPKDEMTLLWNDPKVGINWPITDPILSEKDQKGLALDNIPADRLFA